jgi:diphosphomevalonate decarboxylase
MGKKDSALNIPENSSISMTLHSLCSLAEMTPTRGTGQVTWVPEKPQTLRNDLRLSSQMVLPVLGDRGVAKVIRHFERVREAIQGIFPQWGIPIDQERFKSTDFLLRTANTFPASSGIASSASSFAAMTLAMAGSLVRDPAQFEEALLNDPSLKRELAKISRMGSGSSCRSFEGPWVLWQEEEARRLAAETMPEMAHFVILVNTDPKKVSSSDAHQLIRTSPLWEGRPNRVEARIRKMTLALEKGDLTTLAQIAWTEAWEMHSLFHTCSEPFSYWEPGTLDVLHWFSSWFKNSGTNLSSIPPIVTLDAGPNIHVIVEKSDQEVWRNRLRERFAQSIILEDEQGFGAEIQYE